MWFLIQPELETFGTEPEVQFGTRVTHEYGGVRRVGNDVRASAVNLDSSTAGIGAGR